MRDWPVFGRAGARVGPGVRFLLRGVGRRRRALAAVGVWSVVESVPAVASGRLMATALDDGFLRGDYAAGLVWLLVLGAVTLVGGLGTRGLYPWLGEVVEPLRDDFADAVVRGTLARACRGPAPSDTPSDAAPVARLTRQVETVRDVVAGQLLIVRQFAVTGVAVLTGLLTLAPLLALLVAGPLTVALIGFALLLRPMVSRQRAAYLAEERVADRAGAALAGLRDIAAAGVERRFAEDVGAAVTEQARLGRALAGYGAARRAIVVAGTQVPMVLILLAAGPLGHLTVGQIVGALTYVTVSLEPALRTLVQGVGASALRLSVALRRLTEVGLIGPSPIDDIDDTAPAFHPAAALSLQARALTFRYGPHAAPVVSDLDLTIAADEHLVIVGTSGAGKSTLVNLLAGLLAPGSGEVRLGGTPMTDVPPGALPSLRTLIPQQAYVFAGTVRENVAYLRPDATAAEIHAAADAVGGSALLDRLLDGHGLDAPVTPAALSSGERQLMTLIRAYLSPARVTLLDEATCHLDPAAEARVEGAFRSRPGTLVVVAHRISSALRADRVLLLDGEDTVAGAHDALVTSSRRYAELVGHWNTDNAPEERYKRLRAYESQTNAILRHR